MSEEATIVNGAAVDSDGGAELGVITGSAPDEFTGSVDEDVERVEHEVESDAADPAGGEAAAEADEVDQKSHGIAPEEHDPGPAFGEGYLVWRCEACGEMGELDDGLPGECPNCGSGAVNEWKED